MKSYTASSSSSSSNNNVKTDAKIRKNTLAVCNNGHDNNNNSSQAERNPLFDQKLDIATEGLEPYYLEHLKSGTLVVNTQ